MKDLMTPTALTQIECGLKVIYYPQPEEPVTSYMIYRMPMASGVVYRIFSPSTEGPRKFLSVTTTQEAAEQYVDTAIANKELKLGNFFVGIAQ